MDSSDEELFDVTSNHNTLKTKTNPVNKNSLNTSLKDISVQLIRLSNVKLSEKQTNVPRKIKRNYRWKFGNYRKKRRDKVDKTINSENRRTARNQKLTDKTATVSFENNADKCALMNVQHTCKIEEELLVNNVFGNASCVLQNKEEDSCCDVTYVSAHTLSCNWEKSRSLANEKIDTTKCSDTSLSLSDKIIEGDSCNRKINRSDCTSSQNKVNFIENEKNVARCVKESNVFDIGQFSQKRLNENETTFKRKMFVSDDESSDDESFPIKRRKTYMIVSSDESDEDTVVESSAKIIERNSSDLHSSREIIDQEKSRTTNNRITSELRVILTRLEEMDDADVIKWQESETKDSCCDIAPEQHVEKLRSKIISDSDEEVNRSPRVEKRSRERISLERDVSDMQTEEISERERRSESTYSLLEKDSLVQSLTQAEDIRRHSKDSPEFLMESSTCVEEEESSPQGLENMTNVKKLRKCRMFKKPRVLLIKLETLRSSSEDNTYSAAEIDYLTHKYVNLVMSSESDRSYGFVPMRRGETTDTNIARIGDDDTVSGERSNDDPSHLNRSLATESLARDNQTMENNGDENIPFKICRKLFSSSSENKFTRSETSKNEKDSTSLKKTLLERWRDAFCKETPAKKSQKTTAKQLACASKPLVSVTQSSSRKSSANVECEKVSGSFASTLTSPKKVSIAKSPTKSALPKEITAASVKSTEYNETSTPRSSIASFVRDDNASVDKTVSKRDLVQFKDDIVTTNSYDKDANSIVGSPNPSFSLNNIVSSEETCSKLSEKTSNVKAIDETTPLKWKISKIRDVQSSSNEKARETPRKTVYRCFVCVTPHEDLCSLQKHIANSFCKMKIINSLSDDALKRSNPAKLEKIVMDKIYKHSLAMSKLPKLCLQRCSIDGDNDRSGVSPDKEVTELSRSLSLDSRRKYPSTPQPKSADRKNRLSEKSKSVDLGSQSRSRTLTQLSWKRLQDEVNKPDRLRCIICSRFFDTYLQLSEHIFEHMLCESSESRVSKNKKNNNIAPTCQKPQRKVNDQFRGDTAAEDRVELVGDRTNQVDEPRVELENVEMAETESNAKTRAIRNTPAEVTAESNRVPNLPEAECTTERDRDREERSTDASNVDILPRKENTDNVATCSDESNVPSCSRLGSTEPNVICECHRNETIDEDSALIEIVLLCVICRTLFRRLECFERHLLSIETRAKSRHGRRMFKLFCNGCRMVLNSVQDATRHLNMQNDRTVTVRCNICRVIFNEFGVLFKAHVRSHSRDSRFLSSHLSFPKFCCIGLKHVESSTANNDKSTEVYLRVTERVCRKCHAPFLTEKDLKSHEKNCCRGGNDESADSENGVRNLSELSAKSGKKMPVLLLCGLCSKTFYNDTFFELHSLEHKQKWKLLHMHYIYLPVNAVTAIYICKVCTTQCKSLNEFKLHWLTHNALREVYVCSHCKSRFDNVDLFRKHARNAHDNDNEKWPKFSCEVIYQDTRDSSSHSERRESVREVTTDKSDDYDDDSEKPPQPQPQPIAAETEEIVSRENMESRAIVKVDAKDVSRVSEKRNLSTNANTKSLDNLRKLVEEEIIDISENEESRLERKTDDAASLRMRNDTQTNAASTSASIVVADEKRCSRDTIPIITRVFSCASESSNSNSEEVDVTTLRGEFAESVSRDEAPSASDESVENSTTTTMMTTTTTTTTMTTMTTTTTTTTTMTGAASATSATTAIVLNDSKESLPQNAMSAVPKSFLRVKSLAELMSSAPSRQGNASRNLFNCEHPDCNLSFDNMEMWWKHLTTHSSKPTAKESKQQSGGQTSSSSAVAQTQRSKPELNPAMNAPMVTLPPTMVRNNVTLVTTNAPTMLRNNVPLVTTNAPTVVQNNVLLVTTNAPTVVQNNVPLGTTNAPTVVQNNVRLVTNNAPGNMLRPVLPNYMIDSVRTRQYQVIGVKQLHPVRYTMKNVPNEMAQQRYNNTIVWPLQGVQTLQTVSTAVLSQPIAQRPIYHQNLPAYVAQPIQTNRVIRSTSYQQQNNSTVAIKPFVQSTSKQTLVPLQLSYPLAVSKQQQQQQQQQQFATNRNKSVPRQPVMVPANNSNNALPANPLPTSNVIVPAMNISMRQVSKDPDRYACLFCPDFECDSVIEFVMHERTSKHEARSHYNDVPWS